MIRAKEYFCRPVITLDGRKYYEIGNHIDPFDITAFVFLLPEDEMLRHGKFELSFLSFQKDSKFFNEINEPGSVEIVFDGGAVRSRDELVAGYSSGLV